MQKINYKKLEFYRNSLPTGSGVKIARKIGVSKVAVSHFLHGKYNSEKIENAILEEIAEIRLSKERLMRAAGMID